ncbi:MAG: tetratricopeptide repeat protein [Oscillatoriales cyanobacterium]|nr:MAG: tetratricopeptide repeat protein [Oscillatoriales cyanobacterium]
MDAVTCYSQAVQFNATNPESHLNLGLALLLSGELQRGFSEYEWRLLIKEKQFPLHNFIQPIWDGGTGFGRCNSVYPLRRFSQAKRRQGNCLVFAALAPLICPSFGNRRVNN